MAKSAAKNARDLVPGPPGQVRKVRRFNPSEAVVRRPTNQGANRVLRVGGSTRTAVVSVDPDNPEATVRRTAAIASAWNELGSD